jgi:hypothetical protein
MVSCRAGGVVALEAQPANAQTVHSSRSVRRGSDGWWATLRSPIPGKKLANGWQEGAAESSPGLASLWDIELKRGHVHIAVCRFLALQGQAHPQPATR